MTTPKYNFPEFVFQQPGVGSGNYVDGLNDLSNGVDTELGKTDLILNELTTDQALNNFTVSEDITGGVWTVIITQNEGNNLKFNLDGVVYEHDSDTMSVNGTSLAGTDTEPNNVYVYVKETAGVLELVASNAAPEGNLHHIDCKLFIVGVISATIKTEYGGLDEQLTISEFNTRVWHTAYEAGVKYRSGLTFDATLSSLTISVGEVRVVFKRQSTSQVSVPGTGFFHINALGEFISKNDFSFLNYSDGGTIASNKYYSVVFGVVVNNPTLMFAIVQKQPSTEYTSAIGAYNDELNARTIVPTHPQLTQLFLPICFGVIKNDANNYLQEVSGEYAHPIVSSGGAGGATSVSNVNNGNNESDFVTWNNTTGKYDPKTPIEVRSILNMPVFSLYALECFSSAFSLPINGMFFQTSENGGTAYLSTNNLIYYTNNSPWEYFITTKTKKYKDYKTNLVFKVLDVNTLIQIKLRYDDVDGFGVGIYYGVNITTSDITIVKADSYIESPLSTLSYAFALNVLQTVSVTIIENVINIYINDILELSTTDNDLPVITAGYSSIRLSSTLDNTDALRVIEYSTYEPLQ